MANYDKNIFFESQLNNPNNTWILKAQPWASGKKGSVIQSGSNYTVPVLRGIISEPEFGFSGGHNFNGPGGLFGEGISALKGVVDYANEMSANYGAISNGLLKDAMPGVKEKMDLGVDYFKDQFKDSAGMTKLLNTATSVARGGQFVTGFDQIQVFKGTQLDIDIPPLTTRIFHGVDMIGIDNDHYVSDVVTGLNELLTRFIGPYDETKGIKGLIGLQGAPNGYIPSFKGLNARSPIDGTFSLKYGKYEVRNLLVASFNYRVSTLNVRQCKNKNGGLGSFNIFGVKNNISKSNKTGYVKSNIEVIDYPLYMDISISLRPATLVTREQLSQILQLNKLR